VGVAELECLRFLDFLLFDGDEGVLESSIDSVAAEGARGAIEVVVKKMVVGLLQGLLSSFTGSY